MDEPAFLAVNTLVNCRLDYCNSRFRSQQLQIAVYLKHSRIVTNWNRYSHATPIRKKLHWLPVEFRCIFKTASLVTSKLSNKSFQPSSVYLLSKIWHTVQPPR